MKTLQGKNRENKSPVKRVPKALFFYILAGNGAFLFEGLNG